MNGSSIKEFSGKIKDGIRGVAEDEHLFPALLVVVVGVAAFGLGRLSAGEEILSRTIQTSSVVEGLSAEVEVRDAPTPEAVSGSGAYVASKNSDKYHLPWCSGAQRIAEENKIWFATKEEAEASGRQPAANCKGI